MTEVEQSPWATFQEVVDEIVRTPLEQVRQSVDARIDEAAALVRAVQTELRGHREGVEERLDRIDLDARDERLERALATAVDRLGAQVRELTDLVHEERAATTALATALARLDARESDRGRVMRIAAAMGAGLLLVTLAAVLLTA